MEKNIRNLSDMFIREVRDINIVQWHPLPNGEGKPTQVHMMLNVVDFPGTLCLRFKGPTTLDQIIDALIEHREDVFGRRDNAS